MVATELTVTDESELKTETRMTTRNMQMETGVMILTSSSPRVSRMLVGLGFWAIGWSGIGSIFGLLG